MQKHREHYHKLVDVFAMPTAGVIAKLYSIKPGQTIDIAGGTYVCTNIFIERKVVLNGHYVACHVLNTLYHTLTLYAQEEFAEHCGCKITVEMENQGDSLFIRRWTALPLMEGVNIEGLTRN